MEAGQQRCGGGRQHGGGACNQIAQGTDLRTAAVGNWWQQVKSNQLRAAEAARQRVNFILLPGAAPEKGKFSAFVILR